MKAKLFNKLSILFIFLIIGGIFSCFLRIFPDWDFYSYHCYNGWAFLNDRLGTDFLAASFRSYFNPLLDSITFMLIQSLNHHPYIFLFVTGFKYGLFFFFSYLIYEFCFKNVKEKAVIILFCLLFLFFSPTILRTLGFDRNDIQISCFILVSLFFFLKNIFRETSKKKLLYLFISGLVLGMAVGLKYNVFIYGLSLILCVCVLHKKINNVFKVLFLLLSGMFVGFLITDGYWAYIIYSKFANPLFPYFNNIFHSPYGDTSLIFDYDYSHLRPKSFWSLLFMPFANSTKVDIVAEFVFFDLKIPLIFILSSLYLFFRLRSFRFLRLLSRITDIKTADTVVLLIIFSYYLNAVCFTQVRYIAPVLSLMAIIIAYFVYVAASLLKDKKPSIILFSFAFLMFMFHLIFAEFHSLEIFAVILFIFAVYFLFIMCVNERIPNFDRLLYSFLIIITFCFLGLTRFPKEKQVEYFDLGDVIKFQAPTIVKNSTIFTGTMASAFVAPGLIPDVKYVGYAFQKKYIWKKRKLAEWSYESLTDYSSPYSRNLTQDILNRENDIYLVFAHQDIIIDYEDFFKIFNDSVSDYTGGNIKNVLNNCFEIYYYIFGTEKINIEYEICKIK